MDESIIQFERAFQLCADCDEGESSAKGTGVLISVCLSCPTFHCLTHLLPHLRDAKHAFGKHLPLYLFIHSKLSTEPGDGIHLLFTMWRFRVRSINGRNEDGGTQQIEVRYKKTK